MSETRVIDYGRYKVQKPWPSDCFVQGSACGVVLSRTEDTYTTAFVEAFPRNPNTFIRGEGPTMQAAEEAAWTKFQRYLACPGPSGHEYEPRGYENGAGFCKHCGMFASDVFTAADLGLFCKVCGVPANYSKVGDDYYCQEHQLSRVERRAAMAELPPEKRGSLLEEIFDALMPDDEDEAGEQS